jgi:predicted aspartyl protease/thioredoxin-like negative regulator of GroEL
MRGKTVAVFAVLAVGGMAPAAWAISCPVATQSKPSEAETALHSRQLDKAASLFEAELAQTPNDPAATAGLVQALLQQGKWTDAETLAQKAAAAAPKNAVVLTALAQTQVRGGVPWQAEETTRTALAADPCNPRAHLMQARLARMQSMNATALAQARIAHMLDPYDPEIRSEWMRMLPVQQRITEIEAWLASPTGDDPDDVRRMQQTLDALKKAAGQPHHACRLISSSGTTQLPFAYLMDDLDSRRIRAFGLNMKVNGVDAQLQIDTGAPGILISRNIADRAGLKPFSQTELSGIGSKGAQAGFTAYADSIQVGGMEFRDCFVRVLDSRWVAQSDGLIGLDVFGNFLVTMDYPMRRLGLSPLPLRPDAATTTPSLKSDQAEGSGQEESDAENHAQASGAPAATSPSPPATHGPWDRYIAPEMKDWTRVYRQGNDLIVPVSLDRKATTLFLLDTGSAMTVVSPDAARQVTTVHPAPQSVTVKGISGKVKDVFVADKITLYFGHLGQPQNGVMSFDLSNVSNSMGMEISGLLGGNTLGLTTLQIDYRDGLVQADYQANRGWVR